MITGRLDVVPYNFVEIFKSNHKSFDANECMYILWGILWYWCIVILFFHVELSYCCAVVLRCCPIGIFFCRVVLSYFCIVILSCCHTNMMTHVVLSYCCIVALWFFYCHLVQLYCIVILLCCYIVTLSCCQIVLFVILFCFVDGVFIVNCSVVIR
jgi:hypothetical protein